MDQYLPPYNTPPFLPSTRPTQIASIPAEDLFRNFGLSAGTYFLFDFGAETKERCGTYGDKAGLMLRNQFRSRVRFILGRRKKQNDRRRVSNCLQAVADS